MNRITVGIVAACATLFLSCSGNLEKQREVMTDSGMVIGYVDEDVLAFTGIPYSRAERFMPPQKPERWDGVLECSTFPPRAMQGGGYEPWL